MSYLVKRRITTSDIEPGSLDAATVITPGTITASLLAPNTINLKVYVSIPDAITATNLPAASVGVKWTSKFAFKWSKAFLKSVTIRASWTATATDSAEKICVKDVTTGQDIVCVSGNAGTNAEASTTNLTNVTDGGLFEVYSSVTTASATTTATYSIESVVIELEYGAS